MRVPLYDHTRWSLKAPKLLILTLLVWLVIALLYAHFVPALVGYDGIAHFNYINYLRSEHRLPELNNSNLEFSYELLQQPPLYYLTALLSNVGVPYDNADAYARRSANPYYGKGGTAWTIVLPDTPGSFRTALGRSRAISILGGLLAVLGTWLWVDALLPRRRWLATATAAVVGLNPAFLYTSVTVTNDTWAVAGSAMAIWLITVTGRRDGFSWWRWFAVGAVAGLAALTKYSALVVAIPAVILLVVEARSKGYRWVAAALGLLVVGALTTAGFWYVRNLVAYGELIPLSRTAEVITTFRLPTPLSVAEIRAKLPWLFFSYWGVFGNVFAPRGLLDYWKWFVIIGCVGLGVYALKSRDRSKWAILAACVVWFAAGLLSLLNWVRTISFGDQARLLLVAAPAIALLLVLGWNALAPERWRTVLNRVIAAAFVVCALSALPAIAQAFAMPASLPPGAKPAFPLNVKAENGIQVLGYDLPQGRTLLRGGQVPLTIYLSADHPIAEDYTLFVHLADEDNTLLYQFDGIPFAGRYPTRQWKPGQPFTDSYSLQASATTRPDTLASLEMGFYRMDRPDERVVLYDGNGQKAGDRLNLGKVRVLDSAPKASQPGGAPLATWADQISLLSARVAKDGQANSYSVEAVWQAEDGVPADYTMFVQLLNADSRVVGQIDQQPHGGQAPTSTWFVGETVTDTYTLAVPPTDWQRMIVGIYDAQTGKRLPLSNPTQGQDYFVLQTH